MSDAKIKVLDNGPLLVETPLTVQDADGNEFSIDPEKPSVALCRCGASANKPFCDGAHRDAGFAAIDRA
jgi:CDGSH-type Zn-finger protein